jgi:hypothetical protein
MKNLLFALIFSVILTNNANAQSFTVQYDTVYIHYVGITNGTNGINVPGVSNVTIEWNVIASDFSTDWIGPTVFCDNNLCYTFQNLWPMGSMNTTVPYQPAITDGISYLIDLSHAVTTGVHYITLQLINASIPTDLTTETYIIDNNP